MKKIKNGEDPKPKKMKYKDLRQKLLDTAALKLDEVKGIHISSEGAQNGLREASNAVKTVAEADAARTNMWLNIARAIESGVCAGTTVYTHRKDMNQLAFQHLQFNVPNLGGQLDEAKKFNLQKFMNKY